MNFDPYQEWFGIPPGTRPPNHYLLLGIPMFEDDSNKVHQSALKRISQLRQYQAGKHSDLSQRLMNEISQARLCLLNAAKKTAYDQSLGRPSAVGSAPVAPPGAVIVPIVENDDPSDMSWSIPLEKMNPFAGSLPAMRTLSDSDEETAYADADEDEGDPDDAVFESEFEGSIAEEEAIVASEEVFADEPPEADAPARPKTRSRAMEKLVLQVAAFTLSVIVVITLGLVMLRDTSTEPLAPDGIASIEPPSSPGDSKQDFPGNATVAPTPETKPEPPPVKQNYEPAQLAGLQVLWSAALQSPATLNDIRKNGYEPDKPLVSTDKSELNLTVPPRQSGELYFPPPAGRCRLLVHVKKANFADSQQSLQLAAIFAGDDWIAGEFSSRDDKPTASLTARLNRESFRSGRTIPAGPFWIDLRRNGDQWSSSHSDDGSSFTEVGARGGSGELLGLALRVRNPTDKPLELIIDRARIEGFDESYAGKLASWSKGGPAAPPPQSQPPLQPTPGLVRQRETKSLPILAPKPGEIVNLGFLNTPADETSPWVTPDGLVIYYTEAANNRSKIQYGRRPTNGTVFGEVGQVSGLPDTVRATSLCLTSDLRSGYFSADTLGDFDLYATYRPDAGGRFAAPIVMRNLQSAGQDLDPFITADGLELYFTRIEDGKPKLYVCSRGEPAGNFSEPRDVDIGEDFQHASITADGLTMFVQGQIGPDQYAIYRSNRFNRTTDWEPPYEMTYLENDTAKKGELAPFVTADGKMLYFASDRSGGAGGLDLWVTTIPPDTPVIVQSPATPATTPMVPATPVPNTPVPPQDNNIVPLSGAISEWIVLGPISRTEMRDNGDVKAVRAYATQELIAKPPKVGDLQGKHMWRRESALDTSRAGVYLLALPFECSDSLVVKVTIDRLPGQVMFWLDRKQVITPTIRPGSDLWKLPDSGKATNAIILKPGKHYLFGLVCVGNPQTPLNVRFTDKNQDKNIEGISANFRQ